MSWFGWGRRLAAGCAFVLAACGGGGGGGGGSTSTLSVTADRSQLQFVALGNAPAASQTIRFTLVNGSGTYYGSAVIDRPADFSVGFMITGNTTADVTLTPSIGSTPGTRSGSMTFRLCADEACARVAWSTTIPYTVTVFGIDSSSLAFTGYEGAAAVTQTITVTPPDTGGLLVATASTSTNAAWLSTSRGSNGSIDVSAFGGAVPPGNYQGQVTLTVAGQSGGSALSIPVGFAVGNGIVAPAPAAVDVVYDSTATSLKRQVPIAFNGAQSPAWQATSDQPWLMLTQASGTGAGPLEFMVDPAQLGGLGNWQSASAQVTIQAGALQAATFAVTVNKKLPQLHLATPDTVVASRAGQTVKVYGRGLSQLPSAAWILVDGQPASGTIVSDTQAQLSLPALAAGNVTLRVPNTVTTAVQNAAITAAPLGALAYATAANAGEKRSALFDPSRNAVYAVNRTQDTLVRYRLVGSQWLVDGLPVAQIGDLALAPDRATLYVGSGSTQLLAIDPDALQVRTVHTLTPGTVAFDSLAVSASRTSGMPVTNDLRIWFGGSQWASANYFDLEHGTFGRVSGVSAFNDFFYSPLYFGSADGARLVVSQNGISPAPPTALYAAAGGTFGTTPVLPQVYYAAAWSRDAARLLIDDEHLHDGASGALLGNVQVGAAVNLGSVLAPDGQRIYTIVSANDGSTTPDHVNVYDAGQVTPGTSSLIKLGEIPLPDLALDCGVQVPYGCDLRGALLIGPLGDTLFWVGNQRLVVLPLPNGLSGITAAKRLLPALQR